MPYEAVSGFLSGKGYGDQNIELQRLRQEREREAKLRLLNMLGGDPQRARQAGILGDVEEDLVEDPETGLDSQQRVRKVTDALDASALFNRPELVEQRKQVADERGYGEQVVARGKGVGGAEALMSPVGVAASNMTHRNELEKLLAPQKAQFDQTKEIMGGGFGSSGSGNNQYTHRVNADGSSSFAQRVRPPLPAGIMDRVAGLESSLQIAGEMESIFPDVQGDMTGMGPVSGHVSNFLQWMPGKQADPNWARFVAQTATLKNSIIKAYTGAQMSEPEAIRLGAQIPKETDKPEVWRQKMYVNKQNLRALNVIVDQLHKGVPISDLEIDPGTFRALESMVAASGSSASVSPDFDPATAGFKRVR